MRRCPPPDGVWVTNPVFIASDSVAVLIISGGASGDIGRWRNSNLYGCNYVWLLLFVVERVCGGGCAARPKRPKWHKVAP